MSENRERILYHGTPSQTVNINIFLLCTAIFVLSVLAPTIWSDYLAQNTKLTQYKDIYMTASKVLFFVPIVWALVAWLKVKNHKYTITTERLKEEEGVLSKSVDELELFRVKDISYTQPFFDRIFGCSNIILDTSDKSTPIVVLHAIRNAGPVIELIRHNVQLMRTQKGVREID